MRSLAAADASQDIVATLEAVEKGEEFLVTRDGVPIARIVPERRTTADQIAEVMARHPLPPEAVDEWENSIKELRAWQDDKDRE